MRLGRQRCLRASPGFNEKEEQRGKQGAALSLLFCIFFFYNFLSHLRPSRKSPLEKKKKTNLVQVSQGRDQVPASPGSVYTLL